jgi:hypothetical protein
VEIPLTGLSGRDAMPNLKTAKLVSILGSLAFFGGPAAQAGTGAPHKDKTDPPPIIMNNQVSALITDALSNMASLKTDLSPNRKLRSVTKLCAMDAAIKMPTSKNGTPKSGPIVTPKNNNTEKVEKNHMPK